MIRIFICIFIQLICTAASPARGDTIHVPDDFPSIQEAIDAAIDGDTVIVRPGTYVENITFKGKAITVRSELGAEATVIDGARFGSVATFDSGEMTTSVLDGFTLINGDAADGGGIRCYHGSPTIINNTIANNGGGGIFCAASTARIMNNSIIENTASNSGGGISCRFGSDPLIENNIISRNMAWGCHGWEGGGIHCSESSPTITGNIITLNTASIGGGINLYFSSPVIANNTITRNTAYGGGGIYCDSASPPIVTNNTITSNGAVMGGGIYCDGTSPLITNTILWNNDGFPGSQIYVYHGDPVITCCVVKGGWPGTGNIDDDPLFLDPASDDYHIPFDSPCRSAGDRNAPGLPDRDFEGDPRTGLFALPDIGADEFHTHFYVKGTVLSGNSVTGVIIGWPGTNPVVLISGSGVLPAPDPTPYGDFWLMPPWEHRVHFKPMPDTGVRLIDRVVSTGLPPGTRIPFQALVGMELSNLWVIEIE